MKDLINRILTLNSCKMEYRTWEAVMKESNNSIFQLKILLTMLLENKRKGQAQINLHSIRKEAGQRLIELSRKVTHTLCKFSWQWLLEDHRSQTMNYTRCKEMDMMLFNQAFLSLSKLILTTNNHMGLSRRSVNGDLVVYNLTNQLNELYQYYQL